MSTLISVRTEEENIAALDRIAQSMDRNRNWVLNEAIRSYLELHEWRLQHVQQGRADTEAGRTSSLEDVRGRIAALHKEATSKRKKK